MNQSERSREQFRLDVSVVKHSLEWRTVPSQSVLLRPLRGLRLSSSHSDPYSSPKLTPPSSWGLFTRILWHFLSKHSLVFLGHNSFGQSPSLSWNYLPTCRHNSSCLSSFWKSGEQVTKCFRAKVLIFQKPNIECHFLFTLHNTENTIFSSVKCNMELIF